jgi:hypothetical protein
MVRPFDIPRPVTRIVLGVKVGEDLARHRRVWQICFVVWQKGEMRVLIMAMNVRRGVKRAVRRIRERFWRMWKEMGEDALRGIVATLVSRVGNLDGKKIHGLSFT